MPPYTNIATGIRIYCENPNTCGSPVTVAPPPPPTPDNPLPFITWTPWLGPFGGPANYGGICPCGTFVSVSLPPQPCCCSSPLAATALTKPSPGAPCWRPWWSRRSCCLVIMLVISRLPLSSPALRHAAAAALEHLDQPVIRGAKGGEWRAYRPHCTVLWARSVPTGGMRLQCSTAVLQYAASPEQSCRSAAPLLCMQQRQQQRLTRERRHMCCCTHPTTRRCSPAPARPATAC